MFSNLSMNRRDFMKRSGAAAAGSVALRRNGKVIWQAESGPAMPAASDRVRVAVLGIGARAMGDTFNFLNTPGVEIVAAADVFKDRLIRAKELFGEKLETTGDYRQILDRKDIDAVLIGSPDHWHKRMMIDAMNAGKDVYCEKPMTYKIEDGFEIMDAAKRTNRITQIGSQWVDSPIIEMAKKWIADGRCGQITLVKAWENRNTPAGAWFYPIPPDCNAQNLDWKSWLGDAPYHPFDDKRYCRWRGYWDYSGGLQTDLVVHHLNTLHYMMDVVAPESAMTYGGSYRWKKEYPEFEVPDVVNTLFEYPGFTYNVALTLNSAAEGFGAYFMGTKGTILVDEVKMSFYEENPLDDYGWVVASWPQKLQDEFAKQQGVTSIYQTYPKGSCTAPLAYEHYDVIGDPTDLHVRAFVESVRSRKPTKETTVEGHNAALGAHLANMSYRAGSKKVTWDGKTAKIV